MPVPDGHRSKPSMTARNRIKSAIDPNEPDWFAVQNGL
jgi:hypothetical protein